MASPSPSPSLSKLPPRRVPPPCWTHDETLALIESYHDKWYSLRRGNLKASHWQEVSDSVAARCRFATPSKTSVQCRHKIEKLRKRYRTEKQRAAAASAPPNRFASSWNFFKKMDDMERGPLNNAAAAAAPVDSDDDDENDDDEDDNEDDGGDRDLVVNNAHQINYHRMITNGSGGGGPSGGGGGGGGAFRFRIPGGSRSVPSPISGSPLGVAGSVTQNNNYGRFDESPIFKPNHNSNSSPNPRFFNNSTPRSSSGRGDGVGSVSGVKREFDPVADMVSSIRMLGEGFVRMEQKKIEMAKEMEQMRMEMEMKRTQMILESQQRIVEAFASGMSGKKKSKRMPSPE